MQEAETESNDTESDQEVNSNEDEENDKDQAKEISPSTCCSNSIAKSTSSRLRIGEVKKTVSTPISQS